MKKYPINPLGNPLAVKYDGYHFNKRWSNSIRYLSLAYQYLNEILSSGDGRIIDIGGGYGIFLTLLKQEFDQVKLAVMEFPEQLLLNYYFIANTFPNARINSIKEVFEKPKINKDFIDQTKKKIRLSQMILIVMDIDDYFERLHSRIIRLVYDLF